MIIMTFALVLRRMSALPKVLMLMSRLGGTVTYVAASDGRANMVVRAPQTSAHRFAPQLRRMVDVLDVHELHMVGAKRGAKSQQEVRKKILA
jgi:hypothetical protein